MLAPNLRIRRCRETPRGRREYTSSTSDSAAYAVCQASNAAFKRRVRERAANERERRSRNRQLATLLVVVADSPLQRPCP